MSDNELIGQPDPESDDNQAVHEQNLNPDDGFEVDDFLPEVDGLLPEELKALEEDADSEGADTPASQENVPEDTALQATPDQGQPPEPENNAVQSPHDNSLEIIQDDITTTKTLLEDAQSQKTQLHAELTELGKKFDEGQIGQGEYDAHKTALTDQLDDVKADIRQYSEKSKQLEAAYTNKHAEMEQAYTKTVADWLNKPENASLFQPETEAFAMLDAQVRSISQMKPDISVTDALDKARQATIAILGIKEEASKPAAKPVQPTEKPKRKDAPVQIPDTLADMNSAEQNTLGEFGHIDKLSGLDYEAALAALPPDARQRYLNG